MRSAKQVGTALAVTLLLFVTSAMAEKKAPPPLSTAQQFVVDVALARSLPSSISSRLEKHLLATAEQLKQGKTQQAMAAFKRFLKEATAEKIASSDLEFAQRWVEQKAYLARHKTIDGLALRLGLRLRLVQDLATHHAKLADKLSAKGVQTIDVIQVIDDRLVKSGVRTANAAEISAEMKRVEKQLEFARNSRDEAQSAFQAIDQRVNQLYQILIAIVKTMNDARNAPTKSTN